MTISMLIQNRHTGHSEEIPVCTNRTYHTYWKRAATDENLEMVQALGGLWITPVYRDQFLQELARLREWAAARSSSDEYMLEMIHRVDTIVEAISRHPLAEYEISFG